MSKNTHVYGLSRTMHHTPMRFPYTSALQHLDPHPCRGVRSTRAAQPQAGAGWRRLALGVSLACVAAAASANGFGESGAWQFQTQQDKVGKASIADMIEKKKAGYYDSFKSVYNYNTYIDKQVNCSLTAATTGNTGTNATSASTSSPTVSNAGSTTSDLGANSATSGLSQAGLNGVLVPNAGSSSPTGSLSTGQSNTGNLNSSVSGSNTSAATGAVSANGGTTDQVLNSQQSNSGMLASTITASTACSGPLN